jgi:phosphonate transport system substrate-binding protein
MITPHEGFAYYKQFQGYIEEKLGRDVTFIDRGNDTGMNDFLKSDDLDVTFVCCGPFVDGHEEFCIVLPAAPFCYGGTVYYSYIISHTGSEIRSFQ